MHALKSYARKPRPDEVVVGLAVKDRASLRSGGDRLIQAIATAGTSFGFQVAALASVKTAPPAGAPMSHLIVVDDGPFSEEAVEESIAALATWGTASIAFGYPSRTAMLAAEERVETTKQRSGGRLNLLFPDTERNGWLIASESKIVDNAVCDTVRVKYRPIQRSAKVELEQGERRFFFRASELYERRHLYLRAPADGYFALRREDGFLITATLTRKIGLDCGRISLVHGYDEATNTLAYSGPFLPSSDAVEAAIVMAGRADARALVHTHASKLFTRNPAYRHRILVPPLAYGEPALGHAIVRAFERAGDGFIIMAEHGEVFEGRDPDRLLDTIDQHCTLACAGGGHD